MKEKIETIGLMTEANAQTASNNSIKDRIITRVTAEYGPALKKYETAVGKVAEVKRKKRECEERNNQLREDLESLSRVTMTQDTVEDSIKVRRVMSAEMAENKEIIRMLEGDILRAAEAEAHKAGGEISAVLRLVISSIKEEPQQAIDRLFDQVTSLIDEFNTETLSAIGSLVGHENTFLTINEASTKKMMRSFDLRRAPQDDSVMNFARALNSMRP